MKNPIKFLKTIFIVIFLSPLVIFLLPTTFVNSIFEVFALDSDYLETLTMSFRYLILILTLTLLLATFMSVAIGYFSVLLNKFYGFSLKVLNSIESVPSILIALFCYAPVSGILVRTYGSTSKIISILVFVLAATITVLPEGARTIYIPLSDLYDKKYSISFRSYGFSKQNILFFLMTRTKIMKETFFQLISSILLKTLVLDTSFGYIIQVGLGTTGTPQHISPGALIAANRSAIIFGNDLKPCCFWLPCIILFSISFAFLLIMNEFRRVEK